KIESGHLDSLPGAKKQYAGWQELFDGLKQMLAAHRDVAMQFSPNNFVFTISMVDAGTADMIRGLGKNIVSAADLIAQFEATLTDEQIKSHFAARDVIDAVTAEAFKEIGRRVRKGGTYEHEIQQFFMEAFRRENMVTDDPPIVAVNANSGNPHYEPSEAIRCRFMKATLFCWTCGRRKIPRARFTTTSRGWESWAKPRRTGSARFSRL